jgi:CheY-like chemotaxis protein
MIHEDQANAATRMVLLFGVGLRGDAKLAEQIGYGAYLPRAISKHQLREALLVLLRRSGDPAADGSIVTQHSLADVRFEGVRILLVSSDAVGALVLEAVFRRKGFAVDRVEHVASAAERCEQTPYDFLILDLATMSEADMGLVSGLRVLADQHGPTPALALVDRPSDEIPGLKEMTPDSVFVKPVDLEQICTFCEGFVYPEMAPPQAPRPSQNAIVFVVSDDVAEKDAAIFERARLDESTMGIETLQRSVVESFLADMPRRVDEISAAVAAEDVAAAEREVLSARALALTIGAFATARCLEALGAQIGQKRFEESRNMVARLREESEKSLKVLRAVQGFPEPAKRAA